MVKRVYCGKKTKIYIPKTVNPKIITYRTDDISGTAVQNSVSAVYTDNIAREDYLEKRR